ncbi:hypothetical protein N9Y67_02580 [Pseudomonadota bacterium]|nr:hypothetical protein [Pseudomonadota bacterium]
MTMIQRYIDLCLFKASPADMPASANLLKLTLLAYFLVSVAISLIDMDWTISLFSSFSDMIFMIITVSLLLQFHGLQSRFKQTLIALSGAGICLGLLSFPVAMWFNNIAEAEQASSYAMLFMVIIMFWSLMITSHIFRYALDISVGFATVITVIYTILSLLVLGLTMSGVA